MKHTMPWIKENCEPFVTYDDEFQIWQQKDEDKYWSYDVDEEKFVEVKLVAIERFPTDTQEDIDMRHKSDWCGEIDNSWRFSYNGITTFDYAWFVRVEEEN